MDFQNCPNCQTPIKTGPFSSVRLLNEHENNLINEYAAEKKAAYCSNCRKELYKPAYSKIVEEKKELAKEIQTLLPFLPMITTAAPNDWEITIVGMVTGQSTTGTGVLTEITSDFTDFFGTQSTRTNKKLKKGEELCINQIKNLTLEAGANAIIGVDVDYAEVGSLRGMLMICMSGTAVRLQNTDILGMEAQQNLNRLQILFARAKHLGSIELYA